MLPLVGLKVNLCAFNQTNVKNIEESKMSVKQLNKLVAVLQ